MAAPRDSPGFRGHKAPISTQMGANDTRMTANSDGWREGERWAFGRIRLIRGFFFSDHGWTRIHTDKFGEGWNADGGHADGRGTRLQRLIAWRVIERIGNANVRE